MTGDCLDPRGKGFSDGDPDDTARPVPGSWSPQYFAEGGSPRAGQVLMGMEQDPQDPDNVEPRAILGWHTGNELVIGDDPDRKGLVDTPARVVKAIAERLLCGLIRPTSSITSDLEPLRALND